MTETMKRKFSKLGCLEERCLSLFEDLLPADKESGNDCNIHDMDCSTLPKSFSLLRFCRKEYQHKDFIPVSEFKLENLPDQYRSQCFLDYVRNASQLAVKVTVKCVSPQRELSVKYRLPERLVSRQGSGWISPIVDYDENTTTNATVYFDIITAKHLVYDNREAASTEVNFTNNDREGSLLFSAKGVSVKYTPDDRDTVYLKCKTKNMDVLAHLLKATTNMILATKSLYSSKFFTDVDSDCAFIVSHPHGIGKHITFGYVVDTMEKETEFDIRTGKKMRGRLTISYDIATCPGSSGALVCFMGGNGSRYYLSPHSKGKCDRGFTETLVDWL